MVRQNNNRDLLKSWDAIRNGTDGLGWRTIPIDVQGSCSLLAGRHFPDDMEAILVGFLTYVLPANKQLPQGHGFKVERVDKGPNTNNRSMIALSRMPAGNLDMFRMMAEDVIKVICEHAAEDETKIFRIFLARIVAWQNFMDEATNSILSAESEVGLFGELIVLSALLASGITTSDAMDYWQGPTGSVQDYLIGDGSIEVKSTISGNTFPAKISSLEQLDNSLRAPLYLAAVRLSLNPSGKTLPELSAEVRSSFSQDKEALNLYDCRLIQAGLLPSHSDKYTRHFHHVETSFLLVDEAFSKLTRSNIPVEITKAVYELDLALIANPSSTLETVIESLKV